MRTPNAFNLDDFLKGRELLLVTAAIAADSIGRLVSSMSFASTPRNMRLIDLVLLVMSFGTVLLATLEYSVVKSGGGVDPAFLTSQSRNLFLATLVIGIGAILRTEG